MARRVVVHNKPYVHLPPSKMAKKKSNSTPKQQSEPENRQPEKLRQQDSAEHAAAEEKLQNLKSLNAVLVKQAHELRAERSSLMSANGALEVENARLESEKADAAAASGLEKEVVAVVVGEMRRRGLEMVAAHGAIREKLEREVEELRECSLDADRERDALKAAVAADAEEAAALKSELAEALNRESEVVQVLQQLQKENEAAVRAKTETEATIEILAKEMDSLKISLAESSACSEDLKLEIATMSREKHAMELEKNEKVALIDKLEMEVFDLRHSAFVREMEMNSLQDVLCKLENSNEELGQQRDGLLMELANLRKVSEAGEAQNRELLSEKDVLARTIDEASSRLAESEKVRALLQAEIVELHEALKTQLGEMREMECVLKNELEHSRRSCGTHIEEKIKLLTKLERLKIELEAMIADKARADEDIQLEKDSVESLTRSVAELETRMQERGEEIGRLVCERSQTIQAKESAEARVELLLKEKALLRKRMEETERDLNNARANSDKMLIMLKNASAQLHASRDDGEEFHDDGGVNSIACEIEAIKNAFKSREAAMADTREQLEAMKRSVSEARKGKSLWQLVSTATTIFAAASVAYVSRGR